MRGESPEEASCQTESSELITLREPAEMINLPPVPFLSFTVFKSIFNMDQIFTGDADHIETAGCLFIKTVTSQVKKSHF